MLILINVRNTTTQFGISEADGKIVSFTLTNQISRTEDELAEAIISQLKLHDISVRAIDAAIIASVNPLMNVTLQKMFAHYFALSPMMVEPGIRTGLKMQCDDPREVGADRIIDAVAANTIYGAPALVVSFGTATRFDLVEADSSFSVAVTAPGIQISAEALWNRASKLPKVEIKRPESILATNTVASMQAGIVYGTIGSVNYIVERLRTESGLTRLPVIASGEYAHLIVNELSIVDIYDPFLSLSGLKIIYEKNNR